ncbi:MAG: hypothetical protein MJE77_11160 [Proteobacteria bacterium]|nr:hypothetical protein [Pseudomonadota bacterium]
MDTKLPDPSDNSTNELITTRTFNRVERMAAAAQRRQAQVQTLAYSPRDFVLCSLPYKRVKGLEYERRNGRFHLEVIGHPRHGVPFGQDRLLPIWLATAFQVMKCPSDNTIFFRCARDILRAFKITPDGRQHARLRDRIERVFAATYIVHDLQDSKLTRGKRYQLMRELELSFQRRAAVNQYCLWENRIELDPQFASDIRQSPVPIDLDTVVALKDSPGALDLYIWQAYRSWVLHKKKLVRPIPIPVFGALGLLAQLGSQIQSPRKARQQLSRAQRLIKAAWPECPNFFDAKQDRFFVRPARALHTNAKIVLPGVRPKPPSDLQRSTKPDLVLSRADDSQPVR